MYHVGGGMWQSLITFGSDRRRVDIILCHTSAGASSVGEDVQRDGRWVAAVICTATVVMNNSSSLFA